MIGNLAIWQLAISGLNPSMIGIYIQHKDQTELWSSSDIQILLAIGRLSRRWQLDHSHNCLSRLKDCCTRFTTINISILIFVISELRLNDIDIGSGPKLDYFGLF